MGMRHQKQEHTVCDS